MSFFILADDDGVFCKLWSFYNKDCSHRWVIKYSTDAFSCFSSYKPQPHIYGINSSNQNSWLWLPRHCSRRLEICSSLWTIPSSNHPLRSRIWVWPCRSRLTSDQSPNPVSVTFKHLQTPAITLRPCGRDTHSCLHHQSTSTEHQWHQWSEMCAQRPKDSKRQHPPQPHSVHSAAICKKKQ